MFERFDLAAQGALTRLRTRAIGSTLSSLISLPRRRSHLPPDTTPYRFHLSRHDHHNLELKSNIELGHESIHGRFELYLFLPQSVHLQSYSKTKLAADFHSRARLTLPRDLDDESALLVLEIEKLTALIQAPSDESRPAGLEDEVFLTAKHLGAILSEMLKTKATLHKKEILLAHSLAGASLTPTTQLKALAQAVEQIDGIIEHLRGLIHCGRAGTPPVLELLDQYIHLTYIDYLGSVRGELDRMLTARDRFEAEKYEQGWRELARVLTAAQAKECEWLGTYTDFQKIIHNDLERERHVLKVSQLKKFFQSEMFVNVSQHEAIKRVTEPIAALAAGLAAMAAAAVERMHHADWAAAGFKGLFVLSFGVFIYAFKDRLKDRFRQYFTKRISKILPDFQQSLVVEGKRFGDIKEWFAVKKRGSLPTSVRSLRMEACQCEAEKHVPEDVLHYRRDFLFRRPQLGQGMNRASLNEILRLNLQRYLKHMDDPFKEVRLLDASGNFSYLKSHRVYHFYVCVGTSVVRASTRRRNRALPPDMAPVTQEIFRVVMDKNGIDRVERVDCVDEIM